MLKVSEIVIFYLNYSFESEVFTTKQIIKRTFILILVFTLVLISSANTFVVTAAPSTSDEETSPLTTLNSNYPIVMVHGLFGWGNDELLGINYWGGENSLNDLLTQNGYTVYTPTIGPISSNWDRACELYAYLKGGKVDYGEAHSKKEGHARFGRTFEGVYKELGDTDENGVKKVHLIGHSMGGETIRVLAQLLENGDPEEISNNTTDINPLFTGDHHWIESITTIGTPHDGSQYDEIQNQFEPIFHQFFAAMAVYTGGIDTSNPHFDFRMDQWGLKKQSDESFEDYVDRVLNSNIWNQTNDLSIWDLSLEGAKELNSWVKAQSDIYYFSIACADTHENIFTGHQIPNLNMNPVLIRSSYEMGQYTQDIAGQVKVDSDWWRNDGIVSVRSAMGPHEGSEDQIVDYNPASIEKGVWNYMGEIYNVDHIEVVGQHNPFYQEMLQDKFIEIAEMVTQLPE